MIIVHEQVNDVSEQYYYYCVLSNNQKNHNL